MGRNFLQRLYLWFIGRAINHASSCAFEATSKERRQFRFGFVVEFWVFNAGCDADRGPEESSTRPPSVVAIMFIVILKTISNGRSSETYPKIVHT